MRRKGNEQVELLQPKLSTVLSGTPRQIASLIPDTENGLFSRFIFYYVDFKLTWLNVFASGNEMPFYCFIVFALAGDSTITRLFAMSFLLSRGNLF